MQVEGEQLAIGTYLFHRYMTFDGVKQLINTHKIEKTENGYKLCDDNRDIDSVIKRIEIKKGNIALLWTRNSRLGLLYSIVLLK